MNFVTAPLIANLFLLAILAIGRQEVYEGTIGASNIVPYDIMLFFLSLAYIAISVDASGLIRWLAFKVLQKGGKVGHRLFFYLYAFFFALTTFIGNDPIILSGTAFLSYMTRVSSNIKHPRAWIYTQFSVANIASTILVSSNPTNLVLAGAFNISFIKYTANVIVPVLVTGIVLFPFLLYIIFHDESLIPSSIQMEDLPEELKNRKPVNPNIPFAKGEVEDSESDPNSDDEQEKKMSLEEILNPFLDRKGAMFGAAIMAITLVTVLVLNATSKGSHDRPVYWVTLPAAFVMFCFDLSMGWLDREETRKIAREGRQRVETVQAERAEARRQSIAPQHAPATTSGESNNSIESTKEKAEPSILTPSNEKSTESPGAVASTQTLGSDKIVANEGKVPTTLQSLFAQYHRWAQETFPTTMTVFHHLPFALVPFAFCMFVLVQALVTKGWVPVFAYGWDHWVEKTGTVGAIGGMGFMSVILCNVSLAHANAHNHSRFETILTSSLYVHSSQAQTSEPQSSSRASSNPGKTSIRSTVSQSPTAPSGAPSTAWPLASTTGLSALPSARPWPACSGAISWAESTSTSGDSSSRASICLSLLLRWLWGLRFLRARFISSGTIRRIS